MATVLLPYVQLYTAKGRSYAYYRRGAVRERLAGDIGSPEFLAAYHAAAEKFSNCRLPRGATEQWPEGSLGALILAWQAHTAFTKLQKKTQEGYLWGLSCLTDAQKALPVARMDRAWIIRTQDKLASTPGKANYFVTVLKKALFWGIDRGWLKTNPAMKIERLSSGPGYRAWSNAEIAAFTGPEALAFALPVLLALYTGQRRGDVLCLPWSAYDGHSISLTQSKTGTMVSIPAHPVLKKALDIAALNKTAITICTRPDGHAWRESHFAHAFAAKRIALQLPDDTQFHGLRHSAASRLAEAGASDAQIQAVTGHKSRQMVEHYTKGARTKKMAGDAIAMLPRRQIKNGNV